jgi:hypothetical protein
MFLGQLDVAVKVFKDAIHIGNQLTLSKADHSTQSTSRLASSNQ